MWFYNRILITLNLLTSTHLSTLWCRFDIQRLVTSSTLHLGNFWTSIADSQNSACLISYISLPLCLLEISAFHLSSCSCFVNINGITFDYTDLVKRHINYFIVKGTSVLPSTYSLCIVTIEFIIPRIDKIIPLDINLIGISPS